MSDKVCRENYEVLLQFPFVQKLIQKNKELRKRVKVLESIVYEFPVLMQRPKPRVEPTTEPTLCDTLTDDDDEVRIVSNPCDETPVIDLTGEEVLDSQPNIFIKIEKDAGVEVQVQEAESEQEEEEEEAEEEQEAEAEAEEEQEAEAEEEEEEEEEEPAAAQQDDDTEVFEITIQGKAYYTNNETNGKIYSILTDEDVGPVVGSFVNGRAKFT